MTAKIEVGMVVMWRPELRDYWCKVEVLSKPDHGVFTGKVIDEYGFSDNRGLTYDDWEVRYVDES